MSIPQYSKVRIISERFSDEGVSRGTVGWVIEIHNDREGPEYEVEIMDERGHTLALIVAKEFELEPQPEES